MFQLDHLIERPTSCKKNLHCFALIFYIVNPLYFIKWIHTYILYQAEATFRKSKWIPLEAKGSPPWVILLHFQRGPSAPGRQAEAEKGSTLSTSISQHEFQHHGLQDTFSSPHKSSYFKGVASGRAQAEVNLAVNQLINKCSLSSYMAPGPSSRPARTNLTHKNVQVCGSCYLFLNRLGLGVRLGAGVSMFKHIFFHHFKEKEKQQLMGFSFLETEGAIYGPTALWKNKCELNK